MPSPLADLKRFRKAARKHGIGGALAESSDRTRRVATRARELRAAGAMRQRRAGARELGEPTTGIARERGFAILPGGELGGVDEVVAAARAVVDSTPSDRLSGAHNVNLLDGETLSADSPFVRLALSEELLAPVVDYMGVVPVLRTVDVWQSRHTGAQDDGSRLWHLDGDDVRQIKLFVHCSDVELENGPLTVLDAATSTRIRDAVGYRFGKPRVPDDKVSELRDGAEPVPLTGPAGTTALVDTSACLHFGSRVSAGAAPRVLVMLQYVTPFAFCLDGDYRDSAPYRHLAEDRGTELERLVLGAD